MNIHPAPSAPDPATTTVEADLQTVLTAWHDATVRWEQTQAELQAEVVRLTAAVRQQHSYAGRARSEQLGHVAAQVAHGIRNNLAPATLYLNLLRRRVLDDPLALELVQKAERSCAAADARIDNILHLTMERPPMLRSVDLRALIEDVHSSLRTRLLAQGVMTSVDVPLHTTLLADYAMLRQAVYNLTINALDAMPRGGDLVVTAWSGKGGVELEIADSGHGLSDEARQRAFDPFFSTKCGAGLGLPIVQRLIEAQGGNVVATNCPEGGAAFTLRIPQRALEAAA